MGVILRRRCKCWPGRGRPPGRQSLPVLRYPPGRGGLPVERCEDAYRMGRIYDGLGRDSAAIGAYDKTIAIGEQLQAYYAARAALQAGYIYERRGDNSRAV